MWVSEKKNLVRYRVHNSTHLPPFFPNCSQINPGHGLATNSLVLHSKLTPYLRLGLPSDLFLSGFCIKILYAPVLYIRATCPAHLNFPHLITRTLSPYVLLLTKNHMTFPLAAPEIAST